MLKTIVYLNRFEQEIANQLPPPPQPPMLAGFASEDNFETNQREHQSEYPSHRQHNMPAPRSQYQQNDPQQMLHPFPQLPPLPPLPQSMHMPPSLPLPGGNQMPQFIPPPLPPLLMNPAPVSKPSAPSIKPPTVPIDSYDPKEAAEDKNDAGPSGDGEGGEREKKDRKRKFVRVGGGQTWEDESLLEWDNSEYIYF